MLELTYIAILLVISGAANAVMDTLAHHYNVSVFSRMNPRFWNPNESWKNKWKDGDPKRGEKFLFSSTAFVFLTDAWHLSKFIMLNAFILAVSLPIWWSWGISTFDLVLIFVVMKVCFSIGFTPLYSRVLKKKPGDDRTKSK